MSSADKKVEARLRALLIAAAKMFDEAARAHQLSLPADSEALALLAMQAGAKPMARVKLFPDPVVELGYEHAGEWHPFFSWSATGPAPDMSKMN